MFRTHRRARGAALALASILLAGFAGAAGAAEKCDRSCLTGLVDQYLEHGRPRIARLQVPASVKVTEDARPSTRRRHLETVTGKAPFADYIDVRSGGCCALADEGQTCVYSVLLHVQDVKIAGSGNLVRACTGALPPTSGQSGPSMGRGAQGKRSQRV